MTPFLSPLTRKVPSGLHAVESTAALHISDEKNKRQRQQESSGTSTVAKLRGVRAKLTPPDHRRLDLVSAVTDVTVTDYVQSPVTGRPSDPIPGTKPRCELHAIMAPPCEWSIGYGLLAVTGARA